MIEIYEDENKVYAENYHKIREVINRSDIQKANSFDKRNVLPIFDTFQQFYQFWLEFI